MIEQQGSLFQECSHQRRHMVLMKSGPHYAKLVCSDCDRFLKWEPHPDTIQLQKRNGAILTGLSKVPNLPPWERQFVRDLVTHKHISPKQQETLNLLEGTYLKGPALNDSKHGDEGIRDPDSPNQL